MPNDEFSRLTDVIAMDEGKGRKEEPAKPDTKSEPAGTGTEPVATASAEPDHDHSHDVPADGDGDGKEPDGQGGDTVAKKTDTHTHEEKREYAWKELTRKNAALKRRIRELEEANRRYSESVSKPIKPEDFDDDDKFREASFNQMFDMHDMKKNSDELERARAELSGGEAEELEYRAFENVNRLFPTEEAKKEYSTAVSKAAQFGFGQFLDNTEAGREITDFCNNSEMGAAIIYHLAKHPNDFVTLMKDENSQRRVARLANLESNIGRLYSKVPGTATQAQNKPAQPQAKKELPRMGNLKNTTPAGDISDDDAIAFIRQYG